MSGLSEINDLHIRIAQLEESNYVYAEDAKRDHDVIERLRAQIAGIETYRKTVISVARVREDTITSLRAQLASARKALDLTEYVSRKDSLTEHERLSSVRTVVCAAISALTDEKGQQ